VPQSTFHVRAPFALTTISTPMLLASPCSRIHVSILRSGARPYSSGET
jgi:hypothetical protein